MVQLSISHMPFIRLPMAEELLVGARLGEQHGRDLWQGLSVVKVHSTGWSEAAKIVDAAPSTVAYLAAGATMASNDDASWRDFADQLCDAVRWCADVGVPTIFFTSGRSGDQSPERAADAWCRQIEPVQKLADQRGVQLALENTMSLRSDISFVHSVREAGELAKRAGVGMCVDLFCSWQEHHLPETLAEHRDRIHIMQVSDFTVGTLYQPARRVPGDGDLPLERTVELVRDLGYDRLIDLELLGPAIEEEGPEQAVSRGVDWLCRQNWG